ncbi:SRPBCC family protein [Shewanella cyperi]|uniref:SRPBCC family protein n=1 Tax=Shewanella cyperi TaxID=2814292 RepID=UPI001A94D615|nr:SRPBCC family protein [Shewanella cyperi]QSX40389.1 SRPBCC family protein [Shewanella cyperi]
MLKKILLFLLLLCAIPLVAALFVRKEYAVTTSIVIDKPVAEVYDYVKYLKNQNNYSKWAKMDPKARLSFRGTDGTVGFVSAWDSDNPDVGRGEQEITAMVPNKRIDYELRFLTPFEATDLAFMTTDATAEGKTLVSWGFRGHMDYPMNLMLVLMDFETMIADDLNTGLGNLKTLLEQ